MEPLPQTESRIRASKVFVLSLGVVVLISILAVLAWYGYKEYGQKSGEVSVSDTVISLGYGGERFLYAFNTEKKELVPVVYPGAEDPEQYSPKNIVQTGDSTYFLLQERGSPESNIYLRADDGSFQKLTSTQTVKTDLAYDSVNNVFAFTAWNGSTPNASEVVLWDPETQTEVSLGEGERPTFMQEGAYVVFKNKNFLVAYGIESGGHSILTPLEARSQYAADADTSRVAVYASGAITTYEFKDGVLGDTVRTEERPQVPGMIAYLNGQLMTIDTLFGEDGRLFVLTDLEANYATSVSVSPESLQGTGLITGVYVSTHE